MRRLCVALLSFLLLCSLQTAHAARTDVLVVVNDNSIDSPQIGQYYAQRRDIDPANVVHVRVPDQYYISWNDFQSLRDQILRFGICPSVEAAVRPAACADASLPIYTADTVAGLTAATPIRYIVTTRGVPTRMKVDNSVYGSESTSVDNYLKYWLASFISSELSKNAPYGTKEPFTFDFKNRAQSFGDGRGMRLVDPVQDGEFIIGRIDGVDLNAARALVERAQDAESNGWYGKLYGSTYGNKDYGGSSLWFDYATNRSVYGDANSGWRYAFGLFDESRPECSNYQGASHYFAFAQADPNGKSPAYCQAQFNKGDPNEIIPGVSSARQPTPVDALAYFGSLDGHTVEGGFGTLQNWRKDDTCSVTLCSNAADPAACRAASIDPYKELNTDCVGVASGFIGYNLQSFPVSIFGNWPTAWEPLSVDWNDVPVVSDSGGVDDNYSAWFSQPDQVASPNCYIYSNGVLGTSQQPCNAARKIGLLQNVATSSPDPDNPPTYHLSFYMQGVAIPSATNIALQVTFSYSKPANVACPTGLSGDTAKTTCTYGKGFSAPLAAGDSGWALAGAGFDVTPPAGTGLNYQQATVTLGGTIAGGRVGFDGVSFKAVGSSAELVRNGSFNQGHLQTGNGDYAANFLGRLGGTAFWGSLSHHQSAGHSFDSTSLGSLVYFMRGLPLGDAVWLGEANVSGIFYGDPLYAPLAVRINPTDNAFDFIEANANTNLYGSAMNGSGSAVTTTYSIDYCPGKDFYECDRTANAWQSTGIVNQPGKVSNALLGAWNTSGLTSGYYTLRLLVTSTNGVISKSQTFNDYYPVYVYTSTSDLDTDGRTDRDELNIYHSNPNDDPADVAARDSDGDGLNDLQETTITHTDPYNAHTSDPYVSDDKLDPYGVGLGYLALLTCGLNPLENQAGLDSDYDEVSNLDECKSGRNPLSFDSGDLATRDSDGDGLNDLQEITVTHTDPYNSHSSDPNVSDDKLDPYGAGLGYLAILNCGLNPLENQIGLDSDFDEMSNLDECKSGRNPLLNEGSLVTDLLYRMKF